LSRTSSWAGDRPRSVGHLDHVRGPFPPWPQGRPTVGGVRGLMTHAACRRPLRARSVRWPVCACRRKRQVRSCTTSTTPSSGRVGPTRRRRCAAFQLPSERDRTVLDGDFGDLGADPERVGEHLTSHGLPDLLGGAQEDLEQVASGDDVDEPVLSSTTGSRSMPCRVISRVASDGAASVGPSRRAPTPARRRCAPGPGTPRLTVGQVRPVEPS
jgi:hypothetical protein